MFVLVILFCCVPLSLSCARCDKDRCDLSDLTTRQPCNYCPQSDYEFSTPRGPTSCQCNNQTQSIKCFTTHCVYMIFQHLVNQLHHEYRYFKTIEILECNSDQIWANFFSGLKFRTVYFRDCRNLKSFSPYALSSTADFLETLNLALYSSSANIWSNVFEGIRYLSALKRLQFLGFERLVIPEKAFQSSGSSPLILTDIHFNDGIDRDNSIESIGSQAFKDLPNVAVIDFLNVKIGSMGEYLLKSSYKSIDEPLNIILTADKIVDTKFDQKCFSGTDRTIRLQIKGNGNQLKVKTNYWQNFLDQNENNSINLMYFTLECDQDFLDRLSWIANDFDKYKKQIIGICSDKDQLVNKFA